MQHVVYDPKADCPRILDITDANINDANIGCAVTIEAGAAYVFVHAPSLFSSLDNQKIDGKNSVYGACACD